MQFVEIKPTLEYNYIKCCAQVGEALKCAYTILLMAAYWMTEALPLPITSLMPMVKFGNSLKAIWFSKLTLVDYSS